MKEKKDKTDGKVWMRIDRCFNVKVLFMMNTIPLCSMFFDMAELVHFYSLDLQILNDITVLQSSNYPFKLLTTLRYVTNFWLSTCAAGSYVCK